MNMPFLTMQALLGTDKRPPELPADDSEPGRLTQAIAATRDGFTASITLDRDNLVFFSVPYDEGFSALVNGEEVEVLNVDGGLIGGASLKAPEFTEIEEAA